MQTRFVLRSAKHRRMETCTLVLESYYRYLSSSTIREAKLSTAIYHKCLDTIVFSIDHL